MHGSSSSQPPLRPACLLLLAASSQACMAPPPLTLLSGMHCSSSSQPPLRHACLLLFSASSSSEACLVHLHGRQASASLRLHRCMQRERERERSEREREGWGLVPVSIKGCWSSGLLPHKKAGEQSPTHMSPSALRSPVLMPLCCAIFTQNYNAESDE